MSRSTDPRFVWQDDSSWGPALDGVGSRLSVAELDLWLKDPPAVKPGTTMPNLALSDEVRGELVRWLASLK